MEESGLVRAVAVGHDGWRVQEVFRPVEIITPVQLLIAVVWTGEPLQVYLNSSTPLGKSNESPPVVIGPQQTTETRRSVDRDDTSTLLAHAIDDRSSYCQARREFCVLPAPTGGENRREAGGASHRGTASPRHRRRSAAGRGDALRSRPSFESIRLFLRGREP